MSRRIFNCALLFLTAVLSTIRAQPGETNPAVTVVGITGKWWKVFSNGPPDEELQFGSYFKVLAGENCAAGDGGSLVLLKGVKAYSFPCEGQVDKQCGASGFVLPSGAKCMRRITLAEKSTLDRFIQLFDAFPGPFIQYVTPVSRGLEPQLDEAVIPLAEDRIELRVAFREMDPGTYRVRLEPLTEGGSAAGPVQVQWAEGGAAGVSLPALKPGLYKLKQVDSSGQLAGPEAWVLVTRPQDFEKARAAFQEAVDATQKWPDDVDARAPRAFLRGVLDTLSRQPQIQR